MSSLRIINGTGISRIEGGVKIEKNQTKSTGASVKDQYFSKVVLNKI
jgi:hypothetical protein